MTSYLSKYTTFLQYKKKRPDDHNGHRGKFVNKIQRHLSLRDYPSFTVARISPDFSPVLVFTKKYLRDSLAVGLDVDHFVNNLTSLTDLNGNAVCTAAIV